MMARVKNTIPSHLKGGKKVVKLVKHIEADMPPYKSKKKEYTTDHNTLL